MASSLSRLEPPRSGVHRKVTEWVATYLRDAIIGGQLSPGDRLPLRDIAELLGVSTTPVREALARLQDEGIVIGDAHKTFRIAPLTLDDIRDFHLMHGFLTGILAERAATRLKPDEIARLAEIDHEIHDAAQANDHVRMHDLNFEFHRIINNAAGDTVLRRFVAATNRYVSRRSHPEVPGWLQGAAAEHAPIVRALIDRDGPLARRLVDAHVHVAGERLISDLRGKGWSEHREERGR